MLRSPWGGGAPCWLWFHFSAQPVSGTELTPRAGWGFPVPCRHVSLCNRKKGRVKRRVAELQHLTAMGIRAWKSWKRDDVSRSRDST